MGECPDLFKQEAFSASTASCHRGHGHIVRSSPCWMSFSCIDHSGCTTCDNIRILPVNPDGWVTAVSTQGLRIEIRNEKRAFSTESKTPLTLMSFDADSSSGVRLSDAICRSD